MSNTHNSKFKSNQPSGSEQLAVYQIQLQGHLSDEWTAWFDGLTIRLAANGDTLLTGPVVDQAALHGLLKKVRDLGMPLLLVRRIDFEPIDRDMNREE